MEKIVLKKLSLIAEKFNDATTLGKSEYDPAKENVMMNIASSMYMWKVHSPLLVILHIPLFEFEFGIKSHFSVLP